jgi:hypothetical protein
VATNRGQQNKNDNWLTPPGLVTLLGPFDLDPCCPPTMPWRTARRMLTFGEPTGWKLKGKVYRPKVEDGLAAEWRGRVLLNNPYSKPLPWMERMADHRDGVVVAPAKSTDTRWAQLLLGTCDVTLFLDERISFCYPDGTESAGAWGPYMLCAYGRTSVAKVHAVAATEKYRGIMMKRTGAARRM